MAAEPMVDWIGNFLVSHGERDDLDPENPELCLCGHDPYYTCPEESGAGSIFGMTINAEAGFGVVQDNQESGNG